MRNELARVQLDLLLFYSMNSFVYIFKIYSNSDNVFMFNWDSIWSTSLDTFVCAFIMCGRWLQISTGVVQHEGSRPRYRRRCSTSATVKRNWPSFRLLIDDISTSPCVVRATQHNNRALPPPRQETRDTFQEITIRLLSYYFFCPLSRLLYNIQRKRRNCIYFSWLYRRSFF